MSLKLALVKLSADVHEPLNLLSISAYLLKKFPPLEVKIIDRAYDNVVEEILNFNPDVLCISAMTVEYPLAVKLCKRIKSKIRAPIIIGGVHISFLPASFKPCFDVGVVGEGEIPIHRLIKLIINEGRINKDKLHDMDGVVFYDKGKLTIKPQKEVIEDLDEIPMADRDLINKNYFSVRPVYPIGKYKRWNSIITSRGCPYKCKFCVSTQFFKKLRFNSARRVVDEIKYLYHNYNLTHINIWDDLFCCNVKRLREIVDLMEQEGLLGKITFSCSIRGNLATDEIFNLYEKMGAKAIGLGFESGSNRILRYLKGENIIVEQNMDAIREGIKRGFKMMASFMIGVPTETIEDMKRTHNVIKRCIKLGISRIFFFILTPFPGSEFWGMAEKRGKVDKDMDFSKLSFHDNVPLLLDEEVSWKDYLDVRKEIIKSLNKIKHKCVIEYFLDNPIRTCASILAKPRSSLLKLVWLKGEKEEVNKI